MNQLKAISLFTGAGGLDYGFEAAGFQTRVALEVDERCIETLKKNRSWPLIDRDIGSVTTAELLNAAGLKRSETDVLIGGPPCQPFSKSGFWANGEARRLDDPRANTLTEYLRVLEESLPRAFLLENVEGLRFQGKDEGLRLIKTRLSEINARHGTHYSATVETLNAADFGVPQIRKRVFVIGSRDGKFFQFPKATHVDKTKAEFDDKRPRYTTAWDALCGLPDPNDPTLKLKGKWADLLPSIPEGENYLWHTSRGGGEPLFGWRRRYWSFLLKLAKDQPSWTIQAQPGPATGPFHWMNRKLSMREMARIQTFPNNVVIIGSHSEVQKQLGNAVPSLLAEVIARAIARQLLGKKRKSEEPILMTKPSPTPPPKPESVSKVPFNYLRLRGDHEPHPGTGKGNRAGMRADFFKPPVSA